MTRVDRWVGVALALLAAAVLWSAQAFPAVPGQKLGAGFLPSLVGVGLLLCGLALLRRSAAATAPPPEPADAAAPERVGAPLVVGAAVVGYLLLADRLGFLVVAPLMLLAVFRALGVGWRAGALWAVGGTLVVHVAFYKLLRVPLPWGMLPPLY